MTAQTNDPLSAFAYPQDNTTPATPTDNSAAANTQAVPAQPLTTPLVPTPPADLASEMRGNEIQGPDPVPADPSVLEAPVETPTPDVNTSAPAMDLPVPQEPAAPTSQTTATTEEQKVEEPVLPVDEDEHESPLQALAKKLAKLREDLVQEVPEEAKSADAPTPTVDAPIPTETPKEEMPIPVETPVSESTQPTPPTEMPVPQEPAIPAATLNNPVDMQVPQENATTVPDTTSTPELTTPAPTEMPVPIETTAPVADTTLPTVAAPASSAPASTLEQMFPEVVQKTVESTTSDPTAMPDLNSTPKTDTSSTPLPTQSAIVENSPSTVIDENDNSQVNPEDVEVASANSKYPLTINKIMDIAIERGASDIQVSVGYPVMIRIDGTLIAVHEQVVSSANSEELIMPVLTEQKKELLEVNREVDLAYSPLHNNDARFRINAYYSKGNLTAAFRLIPSKIRTIEELMLPPIYNQLVKLGQGLVLVTGPTGHGKSTTLAAMLQSINLTRAVHMLTIEDPIEYVFKPEKAVIDQREMHDDTHSWTVALKSALRQDPDVILVGEMRDYETIASTVTLAETGHLVFATLHTNSAAQTVDRIIDVFPENQQAQIRTQLSNILEAVVAQRLIPIDGGGRRAVSEIMLGVPAVRNLIREGKTHQLDNVIRTSADIGMISLEQSLVKLVRDGLITMERAQEYAVHPEEVVRLLKS